MFEGRVARSFEAISRKDLEAMMRNMTDDAVCEYPGNTPMSGRFEGKPDIRDWWRRWPERMASVRFTVKHVAFASPVTSPGRTR